MNLNVLLHLIHLIAFVHSIKLEKSFYEANSTPGYFQNSVNPWIVADRTN